eukprot:TRINITY_DN81949_c0_g1_i1.p1 TRINITY_DN81949_c0_g1~~TRINITY_DN81949_c0_g1_i1.p1  ORF type:complete len:215 (-),score=45.95 TRINITY_DN81949_c0_g1_i1:271-915(-)
MYHEKSSNFQMQCGCHCLNNLFGEKWIDPKELDTIGQNLAMEEGKGVYESPTRAWLGNWDIQVINAALHLKDTHIGAHIANEASLPEAQAMAEAQKDKVVGVLINKPSSGTLSRFMGGRHWYAIAPRADTGSDPAHAPWWNLDSKLPKPEMIVDHERFPCLGPGLPVQHIQELLDQDAQMFLIVKTDHWSVAGMADQQPAPGEEQWEQYVPSFR